MTQTVGGSMFAISYQDGQWCVVCRDQVMSRHETLKQAIRVKTIREGLRAMQDCDSCVMAVCNNSALLTGREWVPVVEDNQVVYHWCMNDRAVCGVRICGHVGL